jgi:hypothetical protein
MRLSPAVTRADAAEALRLMQARCQLLLSCHPSACASLVPASLAPEPRHCPHRLLASPLPGMDSAMPSLRRLSFTCRASVGVQRLRP